MIIDDAFVTAGSKIPLISEVLKIILSVISLIYDAEINRKMRDIFFR